MKGIAYTVDHPEGIEIEIPDEEFFTEEESEEVQSDG